MVSPTNCSLRLGNECQAASSIELHGKGTAQSDRTRMNHEQSRESFKETIDVPMERWASSDKHANRAWV